MRNSQTSTSASTVTLDMTDAMELSELLDYLAQWLNLADEHVRDDLRRFAWDDNATPEVAQRLAGFARLLVFGTDPDDTKPIGADLVEPDPDLNWRLSDQLDDLDGFSDLHEPDTSW